MTNPTPSPSSARIAIDLTPLLPDGEGGGAAVLALDLIERMLSLSPRYRFLLLTSATNHEALVAQFGERAERLQVVAGRPNASRRALTLAAQAFAKSRGSKAGRLVGVAARALAPRGPLATGVRRLHGVSRQLRKRAVDMLFCPFTAPTYAEPGVPVVSILYDLQHLAYPEFFAATDVIGRDIHLQWLGRYADKVVCISEYSRRTLIEHTTIPLERTCVIPVAIHDRLRTVPVATVDELRSRLGIHRDYILYPANGWPHKNHERLLLAFAILRERRPELDIDLVFTGRLLSQELIAKAPKLGVQDRTLWLGYRTPDELAALYQGCRMLIFPSLYEGFGVPLLEAMWFGKPVACSDVTSLPEVGGNAVRYFDPTRPEQIAAAIEDVLCNPDLAAELVSRGRARIAESSGDAMATAYLTVFERVLSATTSGHDEPRP